MDGQIVSVEEYQTKKQNLIEMKSQLKQKITEIEETQSFGELFVFLKKVGANFLLSDKKVRFSWQEPYNFLASEAGAAKNSTWSGVADSNC